jgi:hypothetical protein
MRQETEQEDCELRDESGNRTGGLRTERCDRKENRRIANREVSQETEQEDCELRDETGNRTGGLRTERCDRKENRRTAN